MSQDNNPFFLEQLKIDSEKLLNLKVPKPPPPVETGGSDIHYWDENFNISAQEKITSIASYAIVLLMGFLVGIAVFTFHFAKNMNEICQ